MADSHHCKPEIVCVDYGGWISGPSASEAVRANEIRRGDLVLHDGRALVVCETGAAWYHEAGQRVSGIAIDARAPGSRWVLYRAPGEILHRLTAGGQS